MPFLPAGDLPDLGLEPVSFMSPSLACWCFTTSATILFSHKKKEILLFVTPWMDLEGIMPVNAEGRGETGQRAGRQGKGAEGGRAKSGEAGQRGRGETSKANVGAGFLRSLHGDSLSFEGEVCHA